MNDQKVAYTPGPWYTGEADSADILVYAGDFEGVGEGEDCIATVWLTSESQANARLIAAAPDLLEAAKSVIGIHITVENGTSDLKELADAVADLLEAVRKAESHS